MPTEVKIQKMFHRGQWRMALCFAFNGSLNERIKQIGGRYSSSKKCWYLNDDLASFNKLKGIDDVVLLMPEAESKTEQQVAGGLNREILPIVAQNSHALQRLAPEMDQENAVHKPNNKKAEMFPDLQYMGVVGRYWAFKLHYRQKWVQELKKVKGVYWNASHKCYMAFQNEKVRGRIHQILGVKDFWVHHSIKTTTLYTHLAQAKVNKINSPLDQMTRTAAS